MKSLLQHRESPAAFIAGVDVGTSEDFTVLTLWRRTAEGKYLLLDYRQASPGQAISATVPGGTQVLVEESDIGVVG